ncbi:hypothetical protein ACFT1A_02680 [Rhodococcus sp. NPDC057135]|uniref:hypothetical protein n=1 Tax=Rhodococcus sp. NPDC057135 TaxID=3346028 RepID=UPI0036393583
MTIDPDPNLTRTIAQSSTIEHLTSTLSALPAGTYFSRAGAADPSNTLSAGTLIPCDDSNLSENTDVDFSVAYYVRGGPSYDVEAVWDAAITAWSSNDWPIRETAGGDSPITSAYTPDGYKIVIDKAYGSLSISGTSPCFPRPDATDRPSSPMQIDQS